MLPFMSNPTTLQVTKDPDGRAPPSNKKLAVYHAIADPPHRFGYRSKAGYPVLTTEDEQNGLPGF